MSRSVRFYFDPICPWTWVTSRWVTELAKQGLVTVEWLPMSLSILNEGREVPEQFLLPMAASKRALRVIALLAKQSKGDKIADFYTELGSGFFGVSNVDHMAVVDQALKSVRLDDLASELDNADHDVEIRAYHDRALSLAGPDVGSPILQLVDSGAAVYGPIIQSTPRGKDAADLFEHVSGIMDLGIVHEIKRGRTGPPTFG